MFKLTNKRRECKQKKLKANHMVEIAQGELVGYLKSDDLKDQLADIEKDEEKKKRWNSLSTLRKVKVLRYIAAKKGVLNVKK